MGAKFGSELTSRDGVSTLKLVGVVDEDNELVGLENKLTGGPLVLDLSEIDRINSCGVRDWVNWLGRIEKNAYFMQGYSGHGVTCSHLAGKLISEMIRGDAERFDAFASLPHMPMLGGRTFSAPLTALGAVYYSLRDRFGL